MSDKDKVYKRQCPKCGLHGAGGDCPICRVMEDGKLKTAKAQFEQDLRALLLKEMRRRKVGRTMVLFHVMHIVNDLCRNRLRFKAEVIVK